MRLFLMCISVCMFCLVAGLSSGDVEAAGRLVVIANLDAAEVSYVPSLRDAWDGNVADTEPLPASVYAHKAVVQIPLNADVSASNGPVLYNITIYYDLTSTCDLWEYIITCEPDEDGRTWAKGTAEAGLLASGTMAFENNGLVSGLTIELLQGPGDWVQGETNSFGYFTFHAVFQKEDGAITLDMDLDMGIRFFGDGCVVIDPLTSTQLDMPSKTYTAKFYGEGWADSDSDGISDAVDECLLTPEGVTVKANGCVEGDYDNDGDVDGDDLAKFADVLGL